MMKTTNRFLASALACLVGFTAAFSQSTAPAAKELTTLLNEFLVGAGTNDAAVHDRFWAEDLIYTRSAGTRINKEELMKGVRSTPKAKTDAPVTVYKAEDIRIQLYGNTAVVAFRLVGTTTKMDGIQDVAQFLNTGTFVKRNGRWQAVAWQATVVPKAESTTAAETKSATAAPAVTVVKVPGRTYLKGPRGGCYYVSPSGNKTYVNKELCN